MTRKFKSRLSSARSMQAHPSFLARIGWLFYLLCTVLTPMSTAPALSAQPAFPQVTVVGPVLKVLPTQRPPGAQAAQLIAAKNEFESFQIVIQAGSTPLQNLKVSTGAPLTMLEGPLAGTTIPSSHITIYGEQYYNVQQTSDIEGSTGRWPDALVPTVDTIYGETRNAFPATVPAGENRVAWVDILVPQTASTGTYYGSIRVTAQNLSVTVPIRLTVLNFALPSTSSLASAFDIGFDNACLATFGHSCFQQPATVADGWRLNALYARVALDNRITVAYPQYQPITSASDRSLFIQHTLPLLNGTASTRLPGAKLTSLKVDAGQHLAAWRTEAIQRGFSDRAFLYACDEPGTSPTEWNNCMQQIRAARTVWSDLPALVTAPIQNADSFGASGDIDLLVPVINQIEDKANLGSPYEGNQRPKYNTFLQSDPRNQLWLYTSCMSHGCEPNHAQETACVNTTPSGPTTDGYSRGWAGYVIDAPASEARAMGWLLFKYQAKGELYFQVGHCLQTSWTAQYAFGGNGDGTLFYRGNSADIGGTQPIPIESLRMKQIRDGREDFEYLKLLADMGKSTQARIIAEGLFPNTHSTDRTDEQLQTARRQLAELIAPTSRSCYETIPSFADSANRRYFPATGHSLSHGFRSFWEENGGLPIFGYPLTEECGEPQQGGGLLTTQYLERERYEYHPANPQPYTVQLGLLGSEALQAQGRDWRTESLTGNPFSGSQCESFQFDSVQRSVCGPFLEYWHSHGLNFPGHPGVTPDESRALFGLPLTEPKMEVNADGQNVLTQWFERARFEYLPNNPQPHRVLLGRLGAALLQRRGVLP